MKARFSTTALLSITVAMGLAALPASAAEAPKVAAKPMFSFKAPMRGAPATRVGGGTRSAGATGMTLNVLAPAETGYTVHAKPTIYWYGSTMINHPVEVTITAMGSLEAAMNPLLEVTLDPPISKGIHALRLEDYGVTLKSGVEYEYFIAVVKDAKQRAEDVLAGGTIKRVDASADVKAKLSDSGGGKTMRAAVYAESGIWYDAIDELSRQIVADPKNQSLRELRASLLEQVGLSEVAAYDRGTGS
jgi:hypothetical protein